MGAYSFDLLMGHSMTTCDDLINHARDAAAPQTGSGIGLSRLLVSIAVWHERTRQRRELTYMPEHLLKDMGVTWEEAYEESRKPFWRI